MWLRLSEGLFDAIITVVLEASMEITEMAMRSRKFS